MINDQASDVPQSGSSSGVTPQLSLPKGGGAIRGIGEKFSANPVTGTGSLIVPIDVSSGRSGFGPQLALRWQRPVRSRVSWPVRQDSFSSYRSSFEVRTYRLCRPILMFHHFANELGTPDCLVRSTEITYQASPIASLMTAVMQSGFARQNDGTYLKSSLPPREFGYSEARVQKAVRDIDPDSLANVPSSVDGLRYRWLDLDGEGLQSVLADAGEAWYYKRNLTPLSLAIEGGQAGTGVRFESLVEVNRLPGLWPTFTPPHCPVFFRRR